MCIASVLVLALTVLAQLSARQQIDEGGTAYRINRYGLFPEASTPARRQTICNYVNLRFF